MAGKKKFVFDIILEAPEGAIFTSGSKVRGKIIVEATKTIPAKSISLRLYGTEKCLVRYSSVLAAVPVDSQEQLTKMIVNSTRASYRKHNRAQEATTSGQLEDGLADIEKNEVWFYKAMMTEFLTEVQTMIVDEVKEQFMDEVAEVKEQVMDEVKEQVMGKADEQMEEVAEKMKLYVSASIDFIKNVREACSEGKSEKINMDDVKARRLLYAKAGSMFLGQIFPDEMEKLKQAQASLMQVKNAAANFMHVVTGNAHRVKKKGGNAEALNNRHIFDLAIPTASAGVIDGDGKIQPGKYEVPFEVELPDSLPSTMRVVDTNGSSCRIEYRVQATIKGSGWFWDSKCKRSFRIRSKPLTTEPLVYAVGDSTKIRTMGLMGQGVMAYAAKIDDIALDKGETTTVKLAFRNTAKVNIKSVEAILFQESKWGGDTMGSGPAETMTRELETFEIPLDDGTVTESKGTSLNVMLRELHEDLHGGEDVRSISFTMPQDAIPTYSGSLFYVKHWLRIKLKTDSIFTTNPVLEIPLLCGERQEKEEYGIGSLSGMEGVVAVSSSAAKLGGAVQEGSDPDDTEVEAEAHRLQIYVPNFSNLLIFMELSLCDLDIVQDCLADPNWAPVFAKLSPKEYGKMIDKVVRQQIDCFARIIFLLSFALTRFSPFDRTTSTKCRLWLPQLRKSCSPNSLVPMLLLPCRSCLRTFLARHWSNACCPLRMMLPRSPSISRKSSRPGRRLQRRLTLSNVVHRFAPVQLLELFERNRC